MTEKQFTLECESEEICQVAYNGDYMGTDEVVDLLNELATKCSQLKKENEQLKIHMKSAKAHLEGGHTKKAIERLQIADR